MHIDENTPGSLANKEAVRCFGGRIGIPKITPVGLLRYCVLFGAVSVIMGAALVYRLPSPIPTERAEASKVP